MRALNSCHSRSHATAWLWNSKRKHPHLTSFFALAELKSACRLHQPPCTCHLQSSSCHSGLVVHSGHARKTGACQLAGFAKKTFSTPRLRTFNFAHEGFARLSSRRYHASKKDKAGWLAYWQAFRWLQFDFLLARHSCCGEGQDALYRDYLR